MKRILLVVLFAVSFMAIGLLKADTGRCFNCPPKKCVFDLDCDYECWCYIGKYDYYGVCLSK